MISPPDHWQQLKEVLDEVAKEVAKMSPEKRQQYLSGAFSRHFDNSPKCHRPPACDEAQTCVGGCVYGKRH